MLRPVAPTAVDDMKLGWKSPEMAGSLPVLEGSVVAEIPLEGDCKFVMGAELWIIRRLLIDSEV